jgi:hypothetical protein
MTLRIVNYCNPNCAPLQSITRLPEREAYAMAEALSTAYQGEAFIRFADFVNYYPRRIHAEKWLYNWFVSQGGKPDTGHPLYFVLEGSDYLSQWFDEGIRTELPLDAVDPQRVTFTFGDSVANIDRPERRDPFLLGDLYKMIEEHDGGLERFLTEVRRDWGYVEVQLWCDPMPGPAGSEISC